MSLAALMPMLRVRVARADNEFAGPRPIPFHVPGTRAAFSENGVDALVREDDQHFV